MGGAVAALHMLLRASTLVDVGMVVGVDKEDEGTGGGGAPRYIEEDEGAGMANGISRGKDGGNGVPRCHATRRRMLSS